MSKVVLGSLVIFVLVLSVHAQQASPNTKPAQPSEQTRSGFIAPAEVNVRIEPDVRTFVVMAALNMAGFDRETGGQQLSPARAVLRKDLANLDPQLKEKLTAFYKAHRRQSVEEVADAARYAALSLMMTPPPAFSVNQTPERGIPDDLQPLLEFIPLVREFYVKSGIRELVPKYLGIGQVYAAAYRNPVGEVIYDVLDYFHAAPETVISMRPLVVTSKSPDSTRQRTEVFARNRSRQMFVIIDPLAALDTSIVRGDILNQKEDLLLRRVGDDYIVIVGPSRFATTEPVREAMIRFVIDPLVERHLKSSLEYKDQILKLLESAPATPRQYAGSVYLVIRESLAQAATARMRRIHATATLGGYTEDDAMFDLAQGYLRGAVLSFHFYQALAGFEKVGIGIEDFFDQMMATTNFDREAGRPKEFDSLIARVSSSHSKSSKTVNGEEAAAEAVMGAMAAKILSSDDLIRQKHFGEARAILNEVLAVEPTNARALYGMAQVLNQSASTVELDPKADENDKIQAQHDRLEQAIKLYRKAIDNASKSSERWLVQWSHVFLGRILDFQEFRADAIAEYEKAIAMGPDIPDGAYKEAVEGKLHPFGQK